MSEPTCAEQLAALQIQFNQISLICIEALKALPRVSDDPDKQPRVRDLPSQITAIVDLFEQVASDLELPDGQTIFDLPQRAADVMAELKRRRAESVALPYPTGVKS